MGDFIDNLADIVAASNASTAALSAKNAATDARIETILAETETLEFKAQNTNLKGKLHRVRVALAAHLSTEEMLVAELASLAPTNPLANMDNVNKMSSYKEEALFFEPSIVKETFSSGDVSESFLDTTIEKQRKAAILAEEALKTAPDFKP
jgi:hypothetical protein